MVSTEQQHSNMEHEAVRFRIAKLDFALAQIAAHDSEPALQTPAPENLPYLNPEAAAATPGNLAAIMDAVEQAYNTPNEG